MSTISPQVLFLLPEVFGRYGGIQRFNRTLLQAAGNCPPLVNSRFMVLSLNDDFPARSPVWMDERFEFTGFGRRRGAYSWRAMRAARGADLVICGHVFLSPLLTWMKRWAPRARRWTILHGIEAWRRLSSPQLAGLAATDLLLSVSHFTRNRMVKDNPELGGVPWTCFSNVLDPDFGEHPAEPAPREGSRPVVLTVARLEAGERLKGVDVLLQAVGELQRRDRELTLWIVGDGDDRPRLEQIADSMGIAGQVSFRGAVDEKELRSLYAGCDVFALPSAKEGFGIVYLEAMHCGKPCLAAEAGGAPEVVTPETGRLVPPGDVKQTADALESLITDPPDADVVRARCREFAFVRMVEKLESMVEAEVASQ